MTDSGSYQGIKLSFGYKLTWGIAALGTNLIAGIFAALLPIFYQDYLGLSAGWISLASLIYLFWNALNDPIFGFISDSTRSKRGRRIPYMRYTAPFLALSFILVWLAPQKAPDTSLFLWMLVSMILYDGCYTMIGLVYSSLLPEVTESDTQRNHLQISSSLFGLLGVFLGFFIPDFFGNPSHHGFVDVTDTVDIKIAARDLFNHTDEGAQFFIDPAIQQESCSNYAECSQHNDDEGKIPDSS